VGKLVLKLPDGRTREILLDRERVTIGRRADNDVCLPYPAVSGEHAAVVTILDDSFLEDLNSTNGTLVNGRPVAKHFLRDHDEIDIGRQVLVYVSGEFAAAPGGAVGALAATAAKAAPGRGATAAKAGPGLGATA
jgi:pSer/pThr/pTyr-binding forkhead associated (FHA) protein